MKKFNLFIESLSERELISGYIKIPENMHDALYNNARYDEPYTISESYKNPTDFLCHKLIKLLGLKDWQLHRENSKNGVRLIAIIGDMKNNPEILLKHMRSHGFYKKNQESYDENGRSWIKYTFEPKTGEDISDILKKKYKCLYHLSPKENDESIKKTGLVPKHNNIYVDYPKRIYLLNEDISNHNMMILANQLCKEIPTIHNSVYSIWKISLNYIDCPIYADPNFFDGVYVEEPINSVAIEKIEEFDCMYEIPKTNMKQHVKRHMTLEERCKLFLRKIF